MKKNRIFFSTKTALENCCHSRKNSLNKVSIAANRKFYIIHIVLHITAPLLIALALYKTKWLSSYGILLLGLLIDLDHLLANPLYNSSRCSIGFHPLHTLLPVIIYLLLLIPVKTRVFGIGLNLHIALDLADCFMNTDNLCYIE